jgi:hypothetical protein
LVTPVARGGTSVQATDARRRYAMPWWAGLLISLAAVAAVYPDLSLGEDPTSRLPSRGWVPTLTGDAASRLN